MDTPTSKDQIASWPVVVKAENVIVSAFRALYENSPETPEIQEIIRRRAWKLDRRSGDHGALIPEIENRLRMAACRAVGTWNPFLATYTYWARGAIDLEARKIAEELHRRNQRCGREYSLDRGLDDNDQSGLIIDLVDTRNTSEKFYRVIDARACAESLDDESREILRCLMEGHSRREIAWLLGYELHDFYERVWPALAEKIRGWYDDAR